ncbi:MAG: hypothetical protein R2753_13050 [Chitinophagales bacterium]
MSIQKTKNKWTISALVAMLQIGIVSIFFGFHYGWIDDLFFELLFKQQVLCEGRNDLFFYLFFILSNVYYTLYEIAPDFPWIGISYIAIITAAVTCINHLIFKHYSKPIVTPLLLSFSFFGAFLLPLVVYPNFTSISILLSLSVLLLFTNNFESILASKAKFIVLALLFLVAFLIRPPTAFLASLLFLPFILIDQPKRKIFYIAALPMLVVAIYAISIIPLLNNERAHDIKWDMKRIQILDNNIEIDVAKMDDPKLKAFSAAYLSWFFADSTYFEDFDYIDRMLDYQVETNVIQKYSAKLKSEFSKIFSLYNANYHAHLNWGVEFTLLLVLLISLIVLKVYRSKHQTKTIIAYFLSIIFMILIVLLYKMEYRFFYPILVLLLLHLILSNSDNKWLPKILIVLFTGITLFQIYSNLKAVSESKIEYKKISATLSNLENKLASKYILFDQLSVSILHQDLFHAVRFDDKWIAIKESFNKTSEGHKKQLTSLFGCSDFPCLAEQTIDNEDYLFLFSPHRVRVIEDYYEAFYNRKIKFEILPISKDVIEVEYSIFNFPLDIHLYYLKSDE